MAFSSNLRYLIGYKSFTTIQKWETGIAELDLSDVMQQIMNDSGGED